jgi:hypothetical protein
MRVKLTVNNKEIFSNYENVDYNNLNSIHNNSCMELYCDQNVLRFVPNNMLSIFFKEVCSKIRHGGQLIVCGYDLDKITLSYIHKYINEQEVSNLLGSSLGFYNCRMVEEELKTNGLIIEFMSISDNVFVVRSFRD